MQQQLNIITRCDEFKDYDQVKRLNIRALWNYDADKKLNWSWIKKKA